jgi:hypothetical protein
MLDRMGRGYAVPEPTEESFSNALMEKLRGFNRSLRPAPEGEPTLAPPLDAEPEPPQQPMRSVLIQDQMASQPPAESPFRRTRQPFPSSQGYQPGLQGLLG